MKESKTIRFLTDDVISIGYEGTKTLHKELAFYSIYDIMALSYLLGALAVLGAQHEKH